MKTKEIEHKLNVIEMTLFGILGFILVWCMLPTIIYYFEIVKIACFDMFVIGFISGSVIAFAFSFINQ